MWVFTMLILLMRSSDCCSALRRVGEVFGLSGNCDVVEGDGMLMFIDRIHNSCCTISISLIDYWDDERFAYNAERAIEELPARINVVRQLLSEVIERLRGSLEAVIVTPTPSVRFERTFINYTIMDCIRDCIHEHGAIDKCIYAIWLRDSSKCLPEEVLSLITEEPIDKLEMFGLSKSLEEISRELCEKARCGRLNEGVLVSFHETLRPGLP